MTMQNMGKEDQSRSAHGQGHEQGAVPRLVSWEVTRKCNLSCVHCRASSERGPYPGELDRSKSLEVLDQIAATGSPIVILTGG